MIVAVVNLKGGTGKTTSAGHLAHVWHERGRRVALVDADPQQSMWRWSEDVGERWEIPVLRMDTPLLSTKLHGYVSGDQYDVVVIDTPPFEAPPIAMSALKIADLAVVPIPPNAADQERLQTIAELIENSATLRRDDRPPLTVAMLTKVDGRAAAPAVYRQVMTDSGWHVLRAEARSVQRFAQAVGSPIVRASSSCYGDAVDELEALTAVTA